MSPHSDDDEAGWPIRTPGMVHKAQDDVGNDTPNEKRHLRKRNREN